MFKSNKLMLRYSQRLLAKRCCSTPSMPELSTIGWDPLSILTYPGSRALQLSRPDSGNTITEPILNTIKNRLELYSQIETITAVMFSSMSPYFFSSGLETRFLEEKSSRQHFISTANKISEMIANSDKETVGVFNGDIDSTAFGVFATTKFRLGTDSTRFRVSDLLEGRLPIGGGIGHHLAATSPRGFALARYLAVSGRTLSAHDLYMLGMVTHIVSQELTVDNFATNLANTVSEFDNYKAEQKAVVDRTAIMQLLDTMHFYMGDVDISGREAVAASVEDEESVAYAVENWKKIAEEEAQADPVERADMVEQRIKEDLAELESTLGKKVGKKVYLTKNDKLKLISAEKGMRENVFDPVKHAETCISTLSGDLQLRAHHAWDRITPVRPQEINIDLFFDDEEARERAEDLEDVLEEVLHCFSADTVAECRKRVKKAARKGGEGVTVGDWTQDNWAVRTLEQWDSIPEPALIEEWFRMTKEAAGITLSSYYQLEEEKA